jgi:hypothetical protein
MKKILFLLVSIPLLISGCSKEDKGVSSLESTVWEGHYKFDDSSGDIDDFILKFGKSTFVLIKTLRETWNDKTETHTFEEIGTYVYDNPVVILSDIGEDGGSISGTISGKELTLSMGDFWGDVVFTRQ